MSYEVSAEAPAPHSQGPMTTDRHACGLSSILPMSCRGRAEAFARSLQSRLQSLGRGGPADGPHDTEESWLTTSQQAFPTSRQPRLSSSSESDLYFDFDCEFGSPSSPQEEATDAILLNRRRECNCILENQDMESGCASASASATATATSPGSSDSSENNYFDPEASPLNDDLSALIDSTLQQSCSHVQCNGFEPVCLDCGTGTSCCQLAASVVPTASSSSAAENGHSESQCNESKLCTSPCGSESETTPTNETRSDALYTLGMPSGVDHVDNAGLRHSCKRPRKPRVDYTKCNGLRHQYPQHATTEAKEGKTNAHDGDTIATTMTDVETNVTETNDEGVAGMHEEEPKTLEAQTQTPEVEMKTIDWEMALFETKAKAHEAETSTHEVQTQTYEKVDDTPEVEADTHEEQADNHECETITREVQTKTYEADSDTCGNEPITCETGSNTCEAEADTCEAESIACEDETGAQDVEEEKHEVKAETKDAQNSTESPAADESPTTPVHLSTVMIQNNCVEDSCDNNFIRSLNTLKKELLVECPSQQAQATVPVVEVRESTPVVEDDEAPEPVPEGGAKGLDVDDDIDDDRPQRVRRCSSLKTGKTPPGTPGRKKIVRFADVLGLDLADVRTFLDEVPKVPNSAYEDLQDADFSLGTSSSIGAIAASIGCCLPKPDKILVALFIQPGGCVDFLDRVREQQVCLENAVVNDPMLGTIAGTVRVRNLDFHKSVHLRYTVDDWKTFSDLQATYVPNSCDGFSDTFSFTLYAHHVTVGQRLEFAVRFQCHGCQYWDSNRGTNYAFQCLPPAGQSPFRPQHMSTCPDEQWASFY